jgi:hypothetical protein
MIRSTLEKFFLISSFVLIANMLMAQAGNPPPDPGPVPITGIEILLGAGALFGAKRLYDNKKIKH